MDVGVVGLGHMGAKIAHTLVGTNLRVIGYDADPGARTRASESGLEVVTDVSRLAGQASVVLLSLPKQDNVRDVMVGKGGLVEALTEGAVVIDLSTVSPAFTREMAEAAHHMGVGYLDAPVLGRPGNCGRWTLTVGGGGDDLDRVHPVLEILATNVVHVGQSGAGGAFKLLNNLIVGAINAVTGEVLAACASVGIDRDMFVRTLTESGAASVSNLFLELGPRIAAGDYAPTFSLDLLHKDNGLALDMYEEAGLPSLIGAAVQRANDMACQEGHGEQDLSAVTLMFERMNMNAVNA